MIAYPLMPAVKHTQQTLDALVKAHALLMEGKETYICHALYTAYGLWPVRGGEYAIENKPDIALAFSKALAGEKTLAGWVLAKQPSFADRVDLKASRLAWVSAVIKTAETQLRK